MERSVTPLISDQLHGDLCVLFQILFIEHGSDIESLARTHGFSVDSVIQLSDG